MKTDLYIEELNLVTSLGDGREASFQGLQSKPNISLFKIDEKVSVPVSQVNLPNMNSVEEKALFFADKAMQNLEILKNKLLVESSKIAILVGCTKGESKNISKELNKKSLNFETLKIASSNEINRKLSQKYRLPFIPVSSAACATGAQVIQKAAMILDDGKFEKLLLCMTEASLTKEMISAFYQLGVLTNEPNGTAPFDKNHKGFHMGEGAVALVISKIKPQKFNGKIIGAATATDAEHFTTFPNGPKLVWQTIEDLCKKCEINLISIDHVNLHGTGTNANDSMELELAKLFISANANISFSALKPYTGHLLGASGLTEFGLTLLCAQKSWLPPLLNTHNLENSVSSHFVIEPKGNPMKIKYFINLSYGLGSTIGVILGENA
jgi:3-oxoacyl-(acyl-carrier-protein) synthase